MYMKNVFRIICILALLLVSCTSRSANQRVSTEADTSPVPTPPRTVPELTAVLLGDNAAARIGAAEALAKMGPHAEPAIPALIENLNYDNSEVRSAAARALGAIGPTAKSALPMLVDLLHTSSYVGDRRVAIEAIGTIGDTLMVPNVAPSLNDPDLGVAQTAAEVIGRLTGENFPTYYKDSTGHYYSDPEGIPWIVVQARNWWELEGRFQEW